MHYARTFLAVSFLLSLPATAQDYASNGIRGELVAGVTDSYDKLIDLAHAMPDELYDWRPGDGIRSVREVLLHVIGTSYSFAHVAGTPYPEGLNLKEMDAALKSKDDVVGSLLDARDHTLEAMVALELNAFDSRVTWLGGNEGTMRGALLLLSNHTAEHLGQMIAYARMNGVTPPWSEE